MDISPKALANRGYLPKGFAGGKNKRRSACLIDGLSNGSYFCPVAALSRGTWQPGIEVALLNIRTRWGDTGESLENCHENHRTAWWRLKESGGHLVQSSSRATYSKLPKTTSRQLLNILKNGYPTAFLGVLCSCTVALTVVPSFHLNGAFCVFQFVLIASCPFTRPVFIFFTSSLQTFVHTGDTLTSLLFLKLRVPAFSACPCRRPVLVKEMLQFLHHLFVVLHWNLQYAHFFLVVGSPEIDTEEITTEFRSSDLTWKLSLLQVKILLNGFAGFLPQLLASFSLWAGAHNYMNRCWCVDDFSTYYHLLMIIKNLSRKILSDSLNSIIPRHQYLQPSTTLSTLRHDHSIIALAECILFFVRLFCAFLNTCSFLFHAMHFISILHTAPVIHPPPLQYYG